MKSEANRTLNKHPTRAQMDAARADLCAKGKLPPKGIETGLYCWCTFFAGSFFSPIIFTEWGWGAIMILSSSAAYYFGQKADKSYDELAEASAKKRMKAPD